MAAATVLATLVVSVGGTYLLMRGETAAGRLPAVPGAKSASSREPKADAGLQPTDDDRSQPREVTVTVPKAVQERAGIHVAQVVTAAATERLRVPGVVQPDAYRRVTVTPFVAGRVVGIRPQVGDLVRKGQVIGQVYSPELADARTRFVTARAMLDAHERERERTRRLVELGSASRQELERIDAEHAAQAAELESARSKLQLLGADGDGHPASTVREAATMNVASPMDGVVTERLVNPGANVDGATPLLTIVDLSNVWVVADVYERDLPGVHEGLRASIVTAADTRQRLDGRITLIEPQLNATTRTAKVRVEVANPRGALRLGMYADVTIESPGTASGPAVPTGAVQSVGERQVVYLVSPGAPDTFVEREVRLGRGQGPQVEVLAGVAPGDAVVSTGSFFVRAEIERLGRRGAQRANTARATPASGTDVQPVRIVVTEKGFEPDKVRVRAGVPVSLAFLRTTDKTCATEVMVSSLNVRRVLPLNQTVAVDFTPSSTGEVAFTCGMRMLGGVVVIE